MDEALIKKLVQEVLSHPRFTKLRGREVSIFLQQGELNAAAFDNSALVFEGKMGLIFTQSALKLPQDQVRALIAHELAHHLYGDYRSKFWPILLPALAAIGAIIAAFYIPLIIAVAIFGVGFFGEAVAKAHISRHAEYRADCLSAQVAGARHAANLLLTLLEKGDFEPTHKIWGIFNSHPPTKKRIQKIQKIFYKEFSEN